MGEAVPHLYPVPDRPDTPEKSATPEKPAGPEELAVPGQGAVTSQPAAQTRAVLAPVPARVAPGAIPASPLVSATPRPRGRLGSRRVDLKWVCGIPFTFLLLVALVVLAVFQATGRQQAITTLDAMNQQLVTEVKNQQGLGPGGQQLTAFLTQPGFAEKVYEDPGSLETEVTRFRDSSPVLEEDPAAGIKSMLSGYASSAKFLSASTHESLGAVITVLLVLLVITGVPFILLSRRAGKVLSPAVSLAIASWPVLLLLSWVQGSVSARISDFKAAATSRPEQVLADTLKPFADGVFSPAMSTYRTFAYASVAMMAGAALIFGFCRLRERA